MDELNVPKCSREPDQGPQEQKEVNTVIITGQQTDKSSDEPIEPASFTLLSNSTPSHQPSSLGAPLVIRPSNPMPITNQPRMSSLPSPMSLITFNQPQTLFIQALSKLNESNPLSFTFLNNLKGNMNEVEWKSGDVTPPDSLTNAPPSYSFVLRQIAARRRPRLMGTFIPSPSFVQHTPPPTYATAFDIYIDPGPPPAPRVYSYGFTSMPVVCPECGYTGMTVTTCKITICTHLCAIVLCLFCCWICAPLPYVLRSCKDVYHYCRNCRNYLGMYCPTNPEATYPTRLN